MLAAFVWENKFNDGFEAFGAQAGQARTIVQAAIDTWANVIDDFNYAAGSGSHTFQLTINATDLTDGNLAEANPESIDQDGKPHGGTLTFDTAPQHSDGTPLGWFFDPTPNDHGEYYGGDAFYATSAGINTDLYTVALHELGHIIGLSTGFGMALQSHLVNTGVIHVDLEDVADIRSLWTFQQPTYTATFTLGSGGGHLYDGAPLAGLPTHPHDLMNRSIPANMRRLVSDLDAAILRDAYGYTINSTPTFADFRSDASVTLNNGVLTILGRETSDSIVLSRGGSLLNVNVNGVISQFSVSNIYDRIQVDAGWGGDSITFDFSNGALATGTVMYVDGDGGADNFSFKKSAGGAALSLTGDDLEFGSIDIHFKSIGYLEINSGSGADTIAIYRPHDSFHTLNIRAEGGSDTVHIVEASKDTDILLDTGADGDTVHIGQAGGGVAWVEGALIVLGGSGADHLHLHNEGSLVGRGYKLDGNTLEHPGGELYFDEFSTVTAHAGQSTDTFHVNAVPATGTVHFDGGQGNDTLDGPDSANFWTIDNNNAGNLNEKVNFSSVEYLRGGALPDRYKFWPGKHLDGGIDDLGNGTNDNLDYSLFLLEPIVVNLQNFTATGTPSFAGIEYVSGGNNLSQVDQLIGPAETAVWQLTGDRSGRIEWSAGGSQRTFDFYRMDSLLGGSGHNRLTGRDKTNIWDVAGPTNGVLDELLFANFDTLQGGSQNDRFELRDGAHFTGVIRGGSGNDLVNYYAWTSPVTVNMQNFPQVENFWGGSSSPDTFIASNLDNAWDILDNNAGKFSGRINGNGFNWFENLTGGSRSDIFSFYHSSLVLGTINGGGGIDTLDYSLYGSYSGNDVFVDLTTLQATATAGILGIENVTGGIGNDTLTGDANNNLLRGGDGNDTVRGLAGHDILLGGAGQDTLHGGLGRDLLIGGTGSDALYGGKGGDSFTGADDDILIGGTTDYDSLDVKLGQIRDVWTRTGAGNNYSQRITKLSSGPTSKSVPVKLTAATVHNDAAADQLFGQGDLDWFWGTTKEAKDRSGTEQVF